MVNTPAEKQRTSEYAQSIQSSPLYTWLVEQMADLGLDHNEKLGQHFLADTQVLRRIADQTEPGAHVIEIGPGLGQLTRLLADRAEGVTAVEIDRHFEPVLEELQAEFPNLMVIYGDALACRLDKHVLDLQANEQSVQIIANLPYHITEPFMQQAVRMSDVGLCLLVGERFAQAAMLQDPSSLQYTNLSFLCEAFYDVSRVAMVPREAFVPEPKTESSVLKFAPKGEAKYLKRGEYLAQQLFLTAGRSPLVKNVLKEALIEHAELSNYGTRTKEETSRHSRRAVNQELKNIVRRQTYLDYDEESDEVIEKGIMTQNQAREIIATMELSEDILNKPFSQLNNTQIRSLAAALLH